MDCLEAIAGDCKKKNIDLIALKGAALFLSGVFSFREREMTDLDILIKEKDKEPFKEILKLNHFRKMPNSSQAYFKEIGEKSPPLILDVHSELRHIKEVQTIWTSKLEQPAAEYPNLLTLSFEDIFLHLSSHSLLHHGLFLKKHKNDIIKLLDWMKNNKKSDSFFKKTAEKSKYYGLNPVVYYPLKEIFKLRPDLLSEENFFLFKPIGMEKITAIFFKYATSDYSRFLEYFLPVLYRPSLAWKYIFPPAEFIAGRYGKSGFLNGFLRPFRLLKNIIYGNR